MSLAFMDQTAERFDLIFLDGDHSANTVYQEVVAGLRLLNPDGVILRDDYYPDAQLMYPDGTIIVGPCHALDRIGRENSSLTDSVPAGRAAVGDEARLAPDQPRAGRSTIVRIGNHNRVHAALAGH